MAQRGLRPRPMGSIPSPQLQFQANGLATFPPETVTNVKIDTGIWPYSTDYSVSFNLEGYARQ